MNKPTLIRISLDTEKNILRLKEFYKEKTNSKTISRAIRDMCNVLGIK